MKLPLKAQEHDLLAWFGYLVAILVRADADKQKGGPRPHPALDLATCDLPDQPVTEFV